MFLKQISSGKKIEVLSLDDLFNPSHPQLVGRFHVGEELQDPEQFQKSDMQFLSGESLPGCWVDVHYRDDELKR
ncbi:MAG: acetyltransferase [Candidatus Sedimenticola sp. 6PFRAG7]